LTTVVTVDFEHDMALALDFITGGLGGLGFHYNPPKGHDNRSSDLVALLLCRNLSRRSVFSAERSHVPRLEITPGKVTGYALAMEVLQRQGRRSTFTLPIRSNIGKVGRSAKRDGLL
jgi:hypothetical protein